MKFLIHFSFNYLSILSTLSPLLSFKTFKSSFASSLVISHFDRIFDIKESTNY